MSWKRFAALYFVLSGLAVTGCNDASQVVVPDTAPPQAPQNVKAYTKADGHVVIYWTPNVEPDLAGYNIYAMTPFARANNELIPASKASCVLDFRTSTRYRVTAVDNSGNESPPSRIVTVNLVTSPTVDPLVGEDLQK